MRDQAILGLLAEIESLRAKSSLLEDRVSQLEVEVEALRDALAFAHQEMDTSSVNTWR